MTPPRRVTLDELPTVPSRAIPEEATTDVADDEFKEQVFALPLDEFLAEQFPAAPPQLGTAQDTILPAGGLVIVAGMPGVGKTTLVLDAAFHLAGGKSWLGLDVQQPLRILLVENEGPAQKFQQKLQRKVNAWKQELPGGIDVAVWNWGAFNFTDLEDMQAILNYIEQTRVDVIIGDPLDTLGPQGVGSPEDTRAFVQSLVPLGLTRQTSFVFLHHFRKEVTASEIHQVSGAWGGRLDTLMVLKATDRPDELRLSFPKLRWASEKHPLILGKLRNAESFEVIGEETHEPADEAGAQELLEAIIATLRASSDSVVDRTSLALKMGTAPTNRTFQRALRDGFESGLLAKEQKGRKVNYSLTSASWRDEGSDEMGELT